MPFAITSMSNHSKGVLITALGVLFIVPDSLLIRLIDADLMTVVFWRAVFTSVTMCVWTLAAHRGATFSVLHGMGKAGIGYAIFLGFGTMLFGVSIQLTSVANTVFILSTTPVFSAVISRVFLGERISQRMVWTIALCIVGVAVIAFGSLMENAEGTSSSTQLLGDLCAVGSAFGLASAFTVARSRPDVSMVPAVGLGYFIIVFVSLPFAEPASINGASWIYAILLGCIFLPLGMGLMSLGPRYIPSAEVSLLLLLETILAPILVWAVLDEFPGFYALVGGVIVLGVLIVSNLLALRKTTLSQT